MIDRPSPESTRREGAPFSPVVLADGLVWGLALPTVRYWPKVVEVVDELGEEEERLVVVVGFGHPVEITAAAERLEASRRQGGAAEKTGEAFFSLAVALLRRAHEIDEKTAHWLLEVPDDALPALARAVMAVVREGHQPQPRASQRDANT